ncbi:MAG: ATP-binding protein [Caedimonas sp.]|nr:ATP-binding protein [Caedimonas sp.]
MMTRFLQTKLQQTLLRKPAVVLLGPRQVGKTTLAHQISETQNSIYLDLESPEDLQKLSDPLLYLRSHESRLVILDEIQRVPNLFLSLRGIIDERRRKDRLSGHFLLLGSASLDLLKQSSESLAGRVAQLEMTPFTVLEVAQNSEDFMNLWVKGGFPNSFLETNDLFSFEWRQDFIKTYLERDIPQLGPKIPSETLRRFWTMLAHVQCSILNASQLAKGLGVSVQTITRYIDLLVDLLLVRRLQSFHGNVGKRLVKSPKIYIRDSGLLHALLGIKDFETLQGHPVMGGSFEAFVIENCLNCAPSHTNAYFYRTTSGAEIDLLLEMPDKSLWAIEIKRSLSPKLQKGFYYARADLEPKRSFVIYAGRERYSLEENIEAINLYDFLVELNHAA